MVSALEADTGVDFHSCTVPLLQKISCPVPILNQVKLKNPVPSHSCGMTLVPVPVLLEISPAPVLSCIFLPFF